jgi:hypothetical protein
MFTSEKNPATNAPTTAPIATNVDEGIKAGSGIFFVG